MSFNDLAIKNSIGCSKVGIIFKTKDHNIHKKKLHFYISYIKENDRIYLCSLDFNAMTSFDLDTIKKYKDKYNNNENMFLSIFQIEIFKHIHELTKEYVYFYKNNFEDKKTMKSFIKKAHLSLWKSYYLIVFKSYFKRWLNVTYSPENNYFTNEYKNYINILKIAYGTTLLL